ncbi:MAG: pyrroloquinoline quinone biosynthesis protein PqqB [Rhodospirillales bacterium]|nr:pyrroloquinoline quinone biosynthesis protein PqqB [Rhodospirillales bacterium]
MREDDARLRAVVLGSAAGGGVPQWNCRCRVCMLARAAEQRVRPRTQVSVAVSADGVHWLVVGASPDLRQQILATGALTPRAGLRHSPITGVALLNADIDAIAGLLVLREASPFRLFAPPPILDGVRANPVFDVLDPDLVQRVAVTPGQEVDCGHGLTLTMLPMPGKVPLYLEDRAAAAAAAGPTYAARLTAGGRRLLIAPACADLTQPVRQMLRDADVVLFDGTLFEDDEMRTAGTGHKTGRRMGHVSMSGPDGALARLADLPGRRIFIHINNTNPALIEDSPERRAVVAAGWEIAYDGMEIDA